MTTCAEHQGSQWTFRVVMRPGYKENWFFWIFKDFQAREQLKYNATQFVHLLSPILLFVNIFPSTLSFPSTF